MKKYICQSCGGTSPRRRIACGNAPTATARCLRKAESPALSRREALYPIVLLYIGEAAFEWSFLIDINYNGTKAEWADVEKKVGIPTPHRHHPLHRRRHNRRMN